MTATVKDLGKSLVVLATASLIGWYSANEGYRTGKRDVTPLFLMPPSSWYLTLEAAGRINPDNPDDLNGDGVDDLVTLREGKTVPLFGVMEDRKINYYSKEDMQVRDPSRDYESIEAQLNQ